MHSATPRVTILYVIMMMLMMTMLMMMMLMTMLMVNRQNKLETENVKCTRYILKMDVHITIIFLVQDPSGY